MTIKKYKDMTEPISFIPSRVKNCAEGGHVAGARDIIDDERDVTQNILNNAILEEKTYTPADYSGLGRKYLRKNIVNDINTLTQSMINQPNTIYVIQYDFTLGEDITVPDNCVLKFDGGSISGEYTITGNNTKIQSTLNKIFNNDVIFDGTWDVLFIFPEWFGAIGNGVFDCADAFDASIVAANKICATIRLSGNTYAIGHSIHLFNYKNITIEGANVCNAPWKARRCTVKAISNIDVIFKLVDDYPDKSIPTTAAREIAIRNIYIDGNNKATTAINCIDAKIENVTIRFCAGDGIVLEAMTYPVVILDSVVEKCGGNGIRVKAPYTTVYTIERCEVNDNDGYGLLIECGYAGTAIKSVIIQGNKIGGLKILLHDESAEGFTHSIFLGYILFESIYCEGNGLLSSDNEKYEGNYTLYIKGLNASTVDNRGKIVGLSFLNCQFEPSPNNTNKCEGVSNINLFGNTKFPSITESSIPGLSLIANLNSVYLKDYPNSGINRYFFDGNNQRLVRVIDIFPYSLYIKDSDENNLSFGIDSKNILVLGNIFHCVYCGRVGQNYTEESDSKTLRLVLSPSPSYKVKQYSDMKYIIGYGFVGSTHINILLIYPANQNTPTIYFVDDTYQPIKLNTITKDTYITLNINYFIE